MGPETILKACIDLANSERQAIWARTASMLVANAFIANAITSLEDEPFLRVVLSTAGLVICVLWAVLSRRGWQFFYDYNERGREIDTKPFNNPLPDLSAGFRGDGIFKCVKYLIWVFGAIYLTFLAIAVRSLLYGAERT